MGDVAATDLPTRPFHTHLDAAAVRRGATRSRHLSSAAGDGSSRACNRKPDLIGSSVAEGRLGPGRVDVDGWAAPPRAGEPAIYSGAHSRQRSWCGTHPFGGGGEPSTACLPMTGCPLLYPNDNILGQNLSKSGPSDPCDASRPPRPPAVTRAVLLYPQVHWEASDSAAKRIDRRHHRKPRGSWAGERHSSSTVPAVQHRTSRLSAGPRLAHARKEKK